MAAGNLKKAGDRRLFVTGGRGGERADGYGETSCLLDGKRSDLEQSQRFCEKQRVLSVISVLGIGIFESVCDFSFTPMQ